ncbi:MAG: Qat anti-phage system TatD family nuclease QatD, partial [Candidatus Eremiobacterota bacterium]
MNKEESKYFFVDTHCHIDLYPSPVKLVEEIEKNKIYTIGLTNTPSVFTYMYNLAKDKKYLRAAIGFHPQVVSSRLSELNLMWDYIERTRYIGEIGLDYSKISDSDKTIQKQVFEKILERCAIYKNKIISIHSKRSSEDIVNIIGANYPGKVILHWFSGNTGTLKRAIELGFYFSINYSMTNTENGKKIINEIPINKILTETDGPFIKIYSNPATPMDIPKIIENISAILNKNNEIIKKTVFNNF